MLKGKKLEEAFNKWLTVKRLENCSPKTINNWNEFWKRFKRICNEKEFCLDSLLDYLLYLEENGSVLKSKRPWNSNSRSTEAGKLRAITRYFFQRDYIKEDFSLQIPKPESIPTEKTIVSIEIAEEIILKGTQINDNDNKKTVRAKTEARYALQFLLRMPVRLSELLGIRGQDLRLNLDYPMIRTKKKGPKGNWRNVPVPLDMFNFFKDRTSYSKVFCTNADYLNDVLKRGAEALNIIERITCHDFRDVVNTGMQNKGAPLAKTSELLGHSDVKITRDRYTHFSVKDLAETQKAYNPLLVKTISAEDRLKRLYELIEGSGYLSDGKLILIKDKNEVKIIINS